MFYALGAVFMIGYFAASLFKFILTEDFIYVTASLGEINTTEKVQAFITRKEVLKKSELDGYIEYLYTEGEKIPVNRGIARIGDDSYRDIYNSLIDKVNNEISSSQESLQTTNYDENTNKVIEDNVDRYIRGSIKSFDKIYMLENKVKDLLKERYESYIVKNNRALEQLLREKNGVENQLKNSYTTIVDYSGGIISYMYDQYTNLTYEDITYDLIKDYKEEWTRISIESKAIAAKEPIYKLVLGQTWYLTFYVNTDTEYKINQSLVAVIDGERDIKGKIISVTDEKKMKKIVVELGEYIHEYIDKRLVSLTINENIVQGIKLPKSSIYNTELIGIPMNCISKEQGVVGVNKKSDKKTIFNKITIAYQEDQYYYIEANGSSLSLGDQLVYGDNDKTYTLEYKATLPGVYIINKGYEEFRVIEELKEINDYVIVAKDTSNGLRLYDRVRIKEKTKDKVN